MAFNNEIRLQGNLTKDPEYKNISEKNLVTFRLAVNESIGKDREETIYMDVDGWDNHARYAENVMLAKGDRVIVTGRLKQREWTDKNGSNRVSYSVLPSTFSKVVKPRIKFRILYIIHHLDSQCHPNRQALLGLYYAKK